MAVSEAERQVRAALAASSATLEATKRQSDRVLRRKLFEIEELQADIAALQAGGEAAAVRIEALRDTLAAEQQRFIDELAERDRVYAEEIASYRRAVEDIASTPAGLAALARFNAGEEAEALEVLDELRAARDLAAARRIAQLALDAWGRAKVSTASVITRFEEITTLAPSKHFYWVELSRLYVIAGQLEQALNAARTVERTAGSDRDRYVAYVQIGDIFRAQGDRPGALALYQRGLVIAEQLTAADHGNAVWQRDVFVSLNKIGDILVAQGDLASALGLYQRGLEIMEQLSATDPGNAGWQNDVSISLNRIGDVLEAQGDRPGALALYQRGLVIAEQLTAADHGNAVWQRGVSISLEHIGDVLVAQGDRLGALAHYQQGLEIAEQLAAADPGNVRWQRDVIVSNFMLSRIYRENGDHGDAVSALQRALDINSKLIATNDSNAQWANDRRILHAELQRVLGHDQ